MVTPAASPEEAAAVTAAIEQFLAETAPAPASGRAPMSPWQRAALHEGVAAIELTRIAVPRTEEAPWQ
jgi:hypothetical protein